MDEGNERSQRRVVESTPAGEAIRQHRDARGLLTRMYVVGGELADGPLLLDVGEAHLLAGDRLGEVIGSALLALGPLEERPCELR